MPEDKKTTAKAEDEKKAASPAKADDKKTAEAPAKADDKKPAETPAKADDKKPADAPAQDGKIVDLFGNAMEPPTEKIDDRPPWEKTHDELEAEEKAARSKPSKAKKTEAPVKADDKKAVSSTTKTDDKKVSSTATKADDKKPADSPAKTDDKKPAKSPVKTDDKKPAEAPAKADEKKPADAADKADGPAPAEEDINTDDLKLHIGSVETDKIMSVNISDIHKFEGHPFNVEDNKDMWDLVESVKKFGVMEPAVVIPRKEGGYEMVSGHRRHRACQLAGLTSMPVIVRTMDRDEAIINMVDANLKRENISPMEKARAYKMKLEAMKRKAGRRSKTDILTGAAPVRADEQLAQEVGESRATIQRLVRLTNLEPELQNMVDEKKLPVNTAADISYLKPAEQKELADAIKKEDKVPSGTQAAELKKESQAGTLSTEKIQKTVGPSKQETKTELKVTFSDAELRPFFPDQKATVPDVKSAMFDALKLRQKAIERQKAKATQEKAKAKTVKAR